MSIKNILVIGAAGNLGRPVAEHLVSAGFKVSALVRPASKSTLPGGVVPVKTDYTSTSLASAFKNIDAVVCCIATSSLTDQAKLINAAAETGVKRFIPSEFGWDTSDVENALEVAPCQIMKTETVRLLREKEKSGMSWTSVVTGLWIDAVSIPFPGFSAVEPLAYVSL